MRRNRRSLYETISCQALITPTSRNEIRLAVCSDNISGQIVFITFISISLIGCLWFLKWIYYNHTFSFINANEMITFMSGLDCKSDSERRGWCQSEVRGRRGRTAERHRQEVYAIYRTVWALHIAVRPPSPAGLHSPNRTTYVFLRTSTAVFIPHCVTQLCKAPEMFKM